MFFLFNFDQIFILCIFFIHFFDLFQYLFFFTYFFLYFSGALVSQNRLSRLPGPCSSCLSPRVHQMFALRNYLCLSVTCLPLCGRRHLPGRCLTQVSGCLRGISCYQLIFWRNRFTLNICISIFDYWLINSFLILGFLFYPMFFEFLLIYFWINMFIF